MEAAGTDHGVEYPVTHFENALGNRLFSNINQLTEQVITHVDETIVSLKDAADELSVILRKKYPNAVIIQMTNEVVKLV